MAITSRSNLHTIFSSKQKKLKNSNNKSILSTVWSMVKKVVIKVNYYFLNETYIRLWGMSLFIFNYANGNPATMFLQPVFTNIIFLSTAMALVTKTIRHLKRDVLTLKNETTLNVVFKICLYIWMMFGGLDMLYQIFNLLNLIIKSSGKQSLLHFVMTTLFMGSSMFIPESYLYSNKGAYFKSLILSLSCYCITFTEHMISPLSQNQIYFIAVKAPIEISICLYKYITYRKKNRKRPLNKNSSIFSQDTLNLVCIYAGIATNLISLVLLNCTSCFEVIRENVY